MRIIELSIPEELLDRLNNLALTFENKALQQDCELNYETIVNVFLLNASKRKDV